MYLNDFDKFLAILGKNIFITLLKKNKEKGKRKKEKKSNFILSFFSVFIRKKSQNLDFIEENHIFGTFSC